MANHETAKHVADGLSIATVMIANPGLFTTGQSVTVAGAGATFNGTYTITGTVPFSAGTTNLLPAFNFQLNYYQYPQGYSFIQYAKTAADQNFRRVVPSGTMTGDDTKTATYAALSAEGHITGRGPERKADREALMRDGWMPYSIKVGDTYYSYQGMEPVSALMAIAADYAEYAKHEPDASKVEEVFLGATYGLYEYLKEQPYLQGIADVAKLIGTNQQGAVDGKKIVDGLVKQFGGFVIGGSPAGVYSSLVAGISRLSDPTRKDTRADPELPMGVRGFVEAFNKYKSRLPYFNSDLPEALKEVLSKWNGK